MNIIKKLSQGFVLDKIKTTDWAEGSTNPLVVELDTTEACDLACPGCVSEDLIANKIKPESIFLLRYLSLLP